MPVMCLALAFWVVALCSLSCSSTIPFPSCDENIIVPKKAIFSQKSVSLIEDIIVALKTDSFLRYFVRRFYFLSPAKGSDRPF
jgi:hypothetical protein